MSEPCVPCNKEEGEVDEDNEELPLPPLSSLSEKDVGAEPATAKMPPLPICEKCNKDIEVSQDYEDYAGHFVHTTCMEESLLAIILTAPSLDEIRQFKEAKDQMKQMQAMLKDPSLLSKLIGARVNFNDRNFPLWESDESKDSNR